MASRQRLGSAGSRQYRATAERCARSQGAPQERAAISGFFRLSRHPIRKT